MTLIPTADRICLLPGLISHFFHSVLSQDFLLAHLLKALSGKLYRIFPCLVCVKMFLSLRMRCSLLGPAFFCLSPIIDLYLSLFWLSFSRFLPDSCQILARFLPDSCQILTRFCQILARFLPDSC